ncbi:MAG: diguanylate cyclase, partial [Desulfobulbaceae bacterium]|nr:diguanylate cyclase [Desulfobulbaceae bacterium]
DFAARLSQYISAHTIELTDHDPINISMSIGTASYPNDGNDHLELMAAADKALYKIKRARKK